MKYVLLVWHILFCYYEMYWLDIFASLFEMHWLEKTARDDQMGRPVGWVQWSEKAGHWPEPICFTDEKRTKIWFVWVGVLEMP